MYINERAKFVTIENRFSSLHDGTHWYIMIANEEKYKSMDIDGPQGKYESLDDDSIATVICASVCPYTLK